MNKIIQKCDFYFILLCLITIVGTYFFSNYIFSIIGDVGREIYYPKIILDNHVLFKDIFNIFGPFSYLFNAVLYKIFGVNIKVLIVAGYFSALLIVSGTYMLAKQFLDKNLSFIISAFVAIAGVYTVQTFRYNFCPYSYAIVYGLIAFIWGLYFFDKYFQTNNNKYIYVTAFLAGVACCSKYEYFLSALFLFVFLIFYKNNSKIKILSLSLLCFLTPVLICFGYLAYHGLTVNDFFTSVLLIKKLVATNGYQYFYTDIVGTFLSKNSINLLVIPSEKFIIFCILFYLASKFFKKENLFSLIFYGLPLAYFVYFIYLPNTIDKSLSFIIILCIVLFILQFKTLDTRRRFLVISALLVSLKVLWNCNIKFYGVYFLPVLLIILFIMIKKYPQFNITFKVYIVLILFGLLSSNIIARQYFTSYIHIQKVKLYTKDSDIRKIKCAIKYIKKRTKENDSVVIYPDGLIMNYVTGRKVPSMYISAQAPYMEMFTEETFLKYFTENQPQIFILTHKGQYEFNQTRMCESYANEFCRFIKENYKKEVTYKNSDTDAEPFVIYKKIF